MSKKNKRIPNTPPLLGVPDADLSNDLLDRAVRLYGPVPCSERWRGVDAERALQIPPARGPAPDPAAPTPDDSLDPDDGSSVS